MPKNHVVPSLPTVLLTAFLILSNIVTGAYAGMHYPKEPSLRNARIFEYAVTWLLIGFWLNHDSKGREGSFVKSNWPWYLIWPFITPYYLWKTRRARFFLPIIWFIAIFIIATAIGGLTYTLLIF